MTKTTFKVKLVVRVSMRQRSLLNQFHLSCRRRQLFSNRALSYISPNAELLVELLLLPLEWKYPPFRESPRFEPGAPGAQSEPEPGPAPDRACSAGCSYPAACWNPNFHVRRHDHRDNVAFFCANYCF
jgi:hypothetical protein